jgi:hypothetical protein
VICSRTLLLGAAGIALAVPTLVGCGSETEVAGSREYPLVERVPPAMQQPVTMANGAVVTLPALPTMYESEPSPSCERELATYHDGSQPTRRPVVIPPMPGLRAIAVSEHTTRVEWSFRDLPSECRPATIRLTVRNGTDPRATPTTKRVKLDGADGSTEITYARFLPVPTVAFASSDTANGLRSRTASVLIKRDANVSPDPPAATPPTTAPAGRPITCIGRTTVVADPAGDVLTYAPGSPPRPVAEMTPALSAIDITRAHVQINGRTLCASFVLAEPPGEVDFRLTLHLMDATTSSCCASLRFRRTAGRLEAGYHFINGNGGYELRPMQHGGAALRNSTLTISGTLPPPNEWQLRTRRVPTPENAGWSVTTGYAPDTYGPTYGDWLPRHDAVNQPMIRQRDGATVRPGAAP